MADPEVEAELERRLAAAGFAASARFARYWWAESCKIAEQIDNPVSRWEVLRTALRRIGWADDGNER